MANLCVFASTEAEILPSSDEVDAIRNGWRRLLDSVSGEYRLAHHLAGQIPYFYREPAKIASDFQCRHNALEMIEDLFTKLPTSAKFQRSHAGEILASLYLEDCLNLKRLYSKLTLVTTENSNVHKMDGFFVDTESVPFRYFAVEAKSSILPTAKTRFSGHRHGVLKQMVESFDNWETADRRFDFVAIRDNLERSQFSPDEAAQIKRDLVPPGPRDLTHLGIAAINKQTICPEDDDYILTAVCSKIFGFHCVGIDDLADLAEAAFSQLSTHRRGGSSSV